MEYAHPYRQTLIIEVQTTGAKLCIGIQPHMITCLHNVFNIATFTRYRIFKFGQSEWTYTKIRVSPFMIPNLLQKNPEESDYGLTSYHNFKIEQSYWLRAFELKIR